MFSVVSLLLAGVLAVNAQTAGITTRYWDCCKPSCAWSGKASLKSSLQTCDANDKVLTDQNAKSGCDGGSAYMCTKDGPFAVSDTLAYGTAATALAGTTEADTCCSCYKLTFTTAPLIGKTMIVQSINTGGDVSSNQFDLAIPGGGLGIFDGCSREFGVDSGVFGARYGGVSSSAGCDALPAALRSGCKFRFDWMKGADNPQVTFQKTTCPQELVALTGCLRSGETTSNTGGSGGITTTSRVLGVSTTKTTSTKAGLTTTTKATSTPASGSAPVWGQCGGLNYSGPKTCASGSVCTVSNEWYSQCLPK